MKIALIGYGIEGASAYRYLHGMYPDASFEIFDSAKELKAAPPASVVVHSGVEDFRDIDADMVVRTPSIAPNRISSRGTVTSVTNLFFAACEAPIIGVTGTKGKGTTATLIANILQKAGVKTWLVGNIGLPALDVLEGINQSVMNGEDSVVVYELSSFQLWDIEQSPQVAVVLMIEPEHLDVHGTLEDYVAAKEHITAYQTEDDAVIYFASNPSAEKIALASLGEKIPYTVTKEENDIVVDGTPIVSKKDIGLLGEHNIGNVQAAVLAAWQFTQDVTAIRQAVQEFHGLPHRLERVAEKNGILYINDSFASAPPAVLAAVQAFSRPEILIMGGFDRGLDFTQLASDIAKNTQVKQIYLIGQTRQRIAEAFEKAGIKNYESIDGDLGEALEKAHQVAVPGDVVLLSPGCASFDMFKDFVERGNEFKRLVGELDG